MDGGASEPVSEKQDLGCARKANRLRYLCGGRLHKRLAFWWRGRERGSTPGPGWPASRLILAPFQAANCLLPSTERVTMDTIRWTAHSNVAVLQPWWARQKWGRCPTGVAASGS